MVTISTAIESKESVYLLEEGLHLWLTMLLHNTLCSDSLQRMLPWTVKLLEISSEKILTVLRIVEAYVVFAPVGQMASRAMVHTR